MDGQLERFESFDRVSYNLMEAEIDRTCAGVGISTKVAAEEKQTERLVELLNKRATVGWRAAPGRVIGCHLRFHFPTLSLSY